MGNPVGRFEISASDLIGLKNFYSELFDWKLTTDEAKFAVVDPGEGIAGLLFKAASGEPTFVTFYVEVDDCEAYLRRAESLGGTIFVPTTPSPVPGEKCFGVFGDPEGNLVGVRERA